LGVATTKPVKTHVHGFGASWLDVVVDNSKRNSVVCLDGGLGLFVVHLCKELVHWDSLTCVDVMCPKFGLGFTGHDCLKYFGDVENGSIVGWIVDIGGAEKMATGSAACVGFAEVGCFVVHGKDHVTTFVHEDGIWIR
jgi:hypothetical protein